MTNCRCPESGLQASGIAFRVTPLFAINIKLKYTASPFAQPPLVQPRFIRQHFAKVHQLHQHRIFIPIHNPRSKRRHGGISSTNAIIVHPPPWSSPLLDTNPLNMTMASNDPSLWPLIYFYRVISYFIGSWITSRILFAMPYSILFQSQPLLQWYMIGVSNFILSERIIWPLTPPCYSAALTIGQEVGRFIPTLISLIMIS